MFDVFFSETLTWQQQQHNVAASVIMTTNLNWRPPGARNVRISCVPTVTGTMSDLHQPNNTSNFHGKLPEITQFYSIYKEQMQQTWQ